jgi:glycosyltransferase involved in cell wall biosynthesis
MMGWALPRAARVVAVSRALADEIAALGVARDRIAIVMNGVDAELFYPRDRQAARSALGLPERAPLAVYVGNLKPEKGVRELAQAWPDVARGCPGAQLAVVGGGPLAGELASALGNDASVRLVGAQPLASIPQWMAAADIIVLPSHVEGTPNVVLEALASGRRVVASATGGVPDLLTSATLGALVPPRDVAALAHTLAAELAAPYDPAEVARLGARGGWAASASALHDVLRAATVKAAAS